MFLNRSLRPLCIAALLATALGGCGSKNGNPGGGGGGGGSGTFEVTSGPNGGKIAGLNLPVTINFNKSIDPASVGSASIQVVTVADPAGLATAPAGSQANITYEVSGLSVKFVPTVQFNPDGVKYGFLANALYEIAFSPPGSGLSVTSFSGQKLNNSNASFFFRTPDKGFDFNQGYPHARAFFVDDPSGVALPGTISDLNGDQDLTDETIAYFGHPVEVLPTTPPEEVAVSPVRDLIFIFNDAVAPETVLNTIDSSSPTIRVSINTAALPELLQKTVTADYSFLLQQSNLSVMHWHPQFTAWPPGGFLFVEVNALVEDIAGNSKHSVTGSADPDLFALVQVDGTLDTTQYHVLETFDTTAQEDFANTSAAWASDFPGQLGPVLGGGTGADGPFVIDTTGTSANPGQTQVPTSASVNYTTRVVSLPSVETTAGGLVVPRTWEFTTFFLPASWTLNVLTDASNHYVVQSPGDPLDGLGAPLSIRCSGDMQILGTVDVSGVDATTLVRPEGSGDPLYPAYLGQGGIGATTLLAAGDGGPGGNVLLLTQGNGIAVPLKSPPGPGPAYQSSDGKIVGATGRSTILTDTTLFDPNTDLSAVVADPGLSALIAAGEMRLQPNLGVGSSLQGNCGTANENIDENQPTFHVASIAVSSGHSTITVTSNPGDPTLKQPSKNIGKQAIAAAGDCYLLGQLHGRAGTDRTLLERGGHGAEPYVVVNEGALGITTTSGGGGGGGGIFTGLSGQSDGPESNPLVNQRGGSGGIALDDSPGASGGFGSVSGVGRVMNGTDFDLQSQTGGRPLSELTGAALVGSLLIPNVPDDGWMFTITSFNGTTFVIQRIQIDVIDIGLTDGPGVNGPGLLVGHDYAFVIVPSLQVGGAGGGGSGVSVTGTTNNTFTVLPVLAPGAAGGAGGGSLLLETARDLLLGPASRVLARGGKGGKVFDLQTKFAGGGGGGGGNIVIRAGLSLDVFQGTLVSAAGGAGGSEDGFGLGGTGGGGFLRFENFDDSLQPATLQSFTDPPVTGTNVGRMLGLPQGVGQSRFYPTLVVNPEYADVHVNYEADTDGDHVAESHSWSFSEHGISGGAGNLEDPPFRVLFNSVGTNTSGFLDDAAVNTSFYKPSDLVSARTGLAYDSSTGVLLYSVGERTSQIHRLDPTTLLPVASGAQTIVLPTIPSVGGSQLDIVSLAVNSVGNPHEIFLLERVTRKVHVINLDTAAFLRTITLPLDLQGAMAYDPDLDVLVFARNVTGSLVTFRPRDMLAANPATTDYAPAAPLAEYPLSHDGAALESEITGMQYDLGTQSLWCTDAMAGTLFQVSLIAGSEGTSVTGQQRFSPLTSAGAGVVPSSVAFDGSKLYLVHATDSKDCRVGAVLPTAVSLAGAPLNLAGFGTVLPEGALAITDGQTFVRFRISIDGVHNDGVTQFGSVRIDDIDLLYLNNPF